MTNLSVTTTFFFIGQLDLIFNHRSVKVYRLAYRKEKNEAEMKI